MQLQLLVAAVTLMTRLTCAFKVSFYDGPNCAGEFLGTWVGGEGQGCRQDYVGLSEGVVVESTGSVDDNTVVAFYSSNDCNPSNAVGEADGGCIAVDSFASSYQSFNVIGSSDSEGAKTRRRRNNIAKLTRSTEDNADSNLQDSESAVIARDSSETLLDTRAREHGEVSDYLGKTYKWQQVAQDSWRGINPEDWDDKVHTSSDKVIDAAPLPTTDVSTRGLGEIDERNFLYATCQLAKDCVLIATQGTLYTVSAVGSYFVSKALALSGTENLWEFFNQPLIVALTVGIGAAALSGAVSAVTSASLTASKCSDTGTDADALNSLISGIAALSPSRAFQATLSVGGVTGTISMEAVPTTQRGDGNTCGAPATDPSSSPNKMIRSAKFLDLI